MAKPSQQTMEALQLDPKTNKLSVNNIDIPTAQNDQDVIIKIAYAGVCGTDLHIISGEFPCQDKPFTLGHEFCGTVHAVGKEVKTIKVGDRVGVDPNKGCGQCRFCHTSSYHLCPDGGLNSTIGIFQNGGWAQYCTVPSNQVYVIPKGITFRQAVLLEPLSCIYHAYSRISPLHHSSRIMITGAGIAGNLWCSMLHHIGHRNVTVAEPEKGRQDLVKKLETGFNVISPSDIKKHFSEDSVNGIDVCIDCSGNGPAIDQGIKLLNRGGKLCIFGVASPETKVSVSPFEIFLRELTVYGVTINRYAFQHAVGLMEAMGSRYIDYSRLGIDVFTMKQYATALEALKERKISKAVFKIDPTVE